VDEAVEFRPHNAPHWTLQFRPTAIPSTTRARKKRHHIQNLALLYIEYSMSSILTGILALDFALVNTLRNIFSKVLPRDYCPEQAAIAASPIPPRHSIKPLLPAGRAEMVFDCGTCPIHVFSLFIRPGAIGRQVEVPNGWPCWAENPWVKP